jgi:hypothetical protein
MPRFVLLYHACPPGYVRPSHWDLMLESGDMLRAWALAQLPRDWDAAHIRTVERDSECPPLAAGSEVEMTQLAEHRREYLDYEGDLSRQRGRVIRVAAGVYRTNGESADCCEYLLEGDTVSGALKLRRVNDSANRWTLSCDVANRSAC